MTSNPSPQDFRNAMGCFATGVTVVTAVDREGTPVGVTVNSFNSVSLDPPLVLFSLGRKSRSLPCLLDSRRFAIHILRDDQAELSTTFANQSLDKWKGVSYATWQSGCPRLDGALVGFDCSLVATHDGGDHVIFLGRVERIEHGRRGKPLLYYRGRYMRLWEAH